VRKHRPNGLAPAGVLSGGSAVRRECCPAGVLSGGSAVRQPTSGLAGSQDAQYYRGGGYAIRPAIYYFTGTGNSLSVARDIAAVVQGTLISIASVDRRGRIDSRATSIIIVFPSYLAHLYGVPLIVERFVRKIDRIETKRLFAVCTCGGYESVNALPTLRNFRRLVKSVGGRLVGEYSVRLPMNNLDYDHIPVPIETDSATIVRKSKAQIARAAERIRDGRGTSHRLAKTVFNSLMTPMYLLTRPSVIASLKRHAHEPWDSALTFRELFPLTDRSITVNDRCNACGTCVRVCPAENIKLIDGRPVWLHRCEVCFACDEWCPQNAIHHWSRTEGKDYHHPEIELVDMIKQREVS
jgi:formate hydrogenlyase subunit 6/NADH:ubiquinone oxidoreductase subunit I/flavodoxin